MSAIELALNDLESQKSPNFKQTAKKYGVQRTTLARRFKGLTASTAVKNELQSLLSNEQQRALINEINRLSALGTPPTVHMVRVFASDITGKLPGIHWAGRFCKQHHQEITSIYLKGFDISRKKADSWHELKKYFDLVSSLPSLIYTTNISHSLTRSSKNTIFYLKTVTIRMKKDSYRGILKKQGILFPYRCLNKAALEVLYKQAIEHGLRSLLLYAATALIFHLQ